MLFLEVWIRIAVLKLLITFIICLQNEVWISVEVVFFVVEHGRVIKLEAFRRRDFWVGCFSFHSSSSLTQSCYLLGFVHI